MYRDGNYRNSVAKGHQAFIADKTCIIYICNLSTRYLLSSTKLTNTTHNEQNDRKFVNAKQLPVACRKTGVWQRLHWWL